MGGSVCKVDREELYRKMCGRDMKEKEYTRYLIGMKIDN